MPSKEIDDEVIRESVVGHSGADYPRLESIPEGTKVENFGWIDPMVIWNEVCSTEREYQKQVKIGSRQFISIDPHSQLQRATELWGPYGDKWKLTDLVFDTLKVVDENGREILSLMLNATFKYPFGSFPIAVDMKYRPGGDVCKMLITSARSKALSWLGFNADVFLGKWEDEQYLRMQEVASQGESVLREKCTSRIQAAESSEELATIRADLYKMHEAKLITKEFFSEMTSLVIERNGLLPPSGF